MSTTEDVFDVNTFLEEVVTLTPGTLFPFAVKVAARVEKISGKTGAEKKVLVLTTVRSLLEKARAESDPDPKWDILLALTKDVLPEAIDVAISLVKGKIDFTSVAAKTLAADPEKVSNCLLGFCKLFSGRK